jgi:hypothetical protein
MFSRSCQIPSQFAVGLVAFFVVVITTFGTTFVVLLTDRQVILGIDTKQGHQLNGRITDDSQVCKIITRKTSAYAIAGDTGLTGGPDLYPLVNAIASDDLNQTFDAIQFPVANFLSRLAKSMTNRDIEPLIRHQTPVAIIIGIEFKGKSSLRDLSFYVTHDLTIRAIDLLP